MEAYWNDVEFELESAHSITWDGCHKIYIQMDAEQTAQMVEYGYDPIILAEGRTVGNLFATLQHWYFESCGLRFINAVYTVEGDPNDGFDPLIPQFAEEDEEEEW
jgi:hypothetical protein